MLKMKLLTSPKFFFKPLLSHHLKPAWSIQPDCINSSGSWSWANLLLVKKPQGRMYLSLWCASFPSQLGLYMCLCLILDTQRTFFKPETHLEVLSYFVEGDVDCERRGVVVRSERPLSVRAVFHNKVQQSIALQPNTVRPSCELPTHTQDSWDFV